MKTYNLFTTTTDSERGTTILEYVVLAALMGVASMTAVGILGNEVSNTFDGVGKTMAAAGGVDPGGIPDP